MTTTLNPASSEYTEADREALAKILREPLLATAINTVVREAQPEARTLAKLSPEAQASIANQLAGMSELVRRLKKLTTPISQINPDNDISGIGEWTHLDVGDGNEP